MTESDSTPTQPVTEPEPEDARTVREDTLLNWKRRDLIAEVLRLQDALAALSAREPEALSVEGECIRMEAAYAEVLEATEAHIPAYVTPDAKAFHWGFRRGWARRAGVDAGRLAAAPQAGTPCPSADCTVQNGEHYFVRRYTSLLGYEPDEAAAHDLWSRLHRTAAPAPTSAVMDDETCEAFEYCIAAAVDAMGACLQEGEVAWAETWERYISKARAALARVEPGAADRGWNDRAHVCGTCRIAFPPSSRAYEEHRCAGQPPDDKHWQVRYVLRAEAAEGKPHG